MMVLDRPLLFPFTLPQRRGFSPFRRPAVANGDVGPQSLLNVQKLALDPATAVGTQVNVTDALTVTGPAGEPDAVGVYVPIGLNTTGAPGSDGSLVYQNFATGWIIGIAAFATDPGDGAATIQWGMFRGNAEPVTLDGGGWGTGAYWGDQGITDVGADEVTWQTSTPTYIPPFAEAPVPTVTLGGLQQLAAPSTAQAGVFVSGDFGGISLIGGTYSSRTDYQRLGVVYTGDPQIGWNLGLTRWEIFDASGGDPVYYSLSDAATPDLVLDVLPVFTINFNNLSVNGTPDRYGVIQAGGPGEANLIVFDTGTTLNGGTAVAFSAGDPLFNIGISNAPTKQQIINKLVALGGGKVTDLGGLVIRVSPVDHALEQISFTSMTGSGYTTSPQGWFNASDNTAASITVTSVSVGELNAGLFVTNDGVTNGSSHVTQPFHGRQYYMGLNGGGSNNMHWDTDYNVWTDDVGEWTASNVAFPWQGTDAHAGHDGATFAKNDVANEANWEVV